MLQTVSLYMNQFKRKWIVFLVLGIASLFFSISTSAASGTCSSVNASARFSYNAQNILSWHMSHEGLSIKLTDLGRKNYYMFTRNNIGQVVAIYIGHVCVGSSKVHDVISSRSHFIEMDDTTKMNVRHVLP